MTEIGLYFLPTDRARVGWKQHTAAAATTTLLPSFNFVTSRWVCDSGADAIIIATVIAVVAGGAYTGSVIPRVEAEIKNTSKDKVEYDTRMSNAGWEQLDRLAGPLDRCLCLLYMMVASIGIALATAISFIDDLKSPKIVTAKHTVQQLYNNPDGMIDMANHTTTVIIGGDKADGAYSFRQWVCQWEPLLIGNPGHADFRSACRRFVS
ncbi:hypothetical protein KCU73_g365, partial [Aureobasidium melanogenum]